MKKRGKKKAKRVSKKSSGKNMVRASMRKFKLVLRNLILFSVMSLISYVLYLSLGEGFLKNFFSLFAIVLAFISVAFLMVLLILSIMKVMKK